MNENPMSMLLKEILLVISILFCSILLVNCSNSDTTSAFPDEKGPLAQGHDKFLGSIIGGFGNNEMINDPDFLNYWNQVTPENAGKHGLTETKKDSYKFTAMDQIYQFAIENDLPLKQHTFLFWCCGADPDWIMDLNDSEIREEMEEWIRDFLARYPELEFIEVVNEPFQSPPPRKFREALGGDEDFTWVRWVFSKTREYASGSTKLLINENNVLRGGDRIDKYLELISLLKEDGTIDGVGIQGHWLENVSANTIHNSLDKMQQSGLPLFITEYDVNQSDDILQKQIIENQFPVFWEHPAVKGVTFWGHNEGKIWRKDAFLINSDGTERPALKWLREYLQN